MYIQIYWIHFMRSTVLSVKKIGWKAGLFCRPFDNKEVERLAFKEGLLQKLKVWDKIASLASEDVASVLKSRLRCFTFSPLPPPRETRTQLSSAAIVVSSCWFYRKLLSKKESRANGSIIIMNIISKKQILSIIFQQNVEIKMSDWLKVLEKLVYDRHIAQKLKRTW